MTLRTRILLTTAPLLLLTAALGAADAVLLFRVSGQIDAILHENLDSVDYMVGLHQSLEDVDASFHLALLGRDDARRRYDAGWKECLHWQDKEEHNVTIHPREDELVKELRELTSDYRDAGDTFFNPAATRDDRWKTYFGAGKDDGLEEQVRKIQETVNEIRLINEGQMQKASADAKAEARGWCWWLLGGLAGAALLVGLLAWTTVRAVLTPLRDLARIALAVGAGNFNQIVPAGDDEVGQVARAFNRMTVQLRDYRQSHSSRLLRAQRNGQATIDSFPDPILVVDPAGRVEMANPAARRLLGVDPPAWNEETNASAATDVWQPPDPLRGPLADALQKQQPFLTQAFDQTITFRLDDEERAYLPQILPIRDPYGNTLGAAVVLNDVTRFRLLDQIKSNLAATVSHELKTPLTGVRLALHLLLEETVGPLTPKQTELLVDARDNAERLLKTIEHLLALAQLEHGGPARGPQPEAPLMLLQTSADAVRPRAEAKHIAVVVVDAPDLPAVAADPHRLGQALNNLLDNALTYTEPGGRITLSAAVVGDDRVRLSVADTGGGIPAEYLPHVFDRFFRVPGQSHGRGTGLGLAIVREIVVAHGGEVACVSEPGHGTIFHLTLPVWKGVTP